MRPKYTPLEAFVIVKLRRLRILRFRNVEPGTQVVFDDGVNVLLGKNGTGKTTLLGLISCACRSDFSSFEAEEHEIDYDLQVGDVELQVVVARKRSLGEDTGEGELRPWAELRVKSSGLDFTIKAGLGTIAVSGTGIIPAAGGAGPVAVPIDPAGPGFLERLLGVALKKVAGSHAQLTAVRALLACQKDAYRFDESVAAFRAMTGRSPDNGLCCPAGAQLVVQRHPDGDTSSTTRYVPDGLARLVEKVTDRSPSLPLDRAPFRDWAKLAGFDAIEWQPQLLEEAAGGLQRTYATFKYYLRRADGSSISHDLLSYGQKRLLALLYHLDVNENFLIADELVNGLHHEWIEAVVKRIEPRQAFLTSQNPLLFDFLTIESAEQAQAMFITCSSRADADGRVQLQWRNMTKAEASDFHESHQAGVQYVSEILLNRGLW